MKRSALTTKINIKEANHAHTHNLLRAWRWWIGPAALALLLSFIFRDPFIGDWDAFDYTILSLRGQPSSMALGRSLFIYANHTLWLAGQTLFHLPAESAYLLFKYAVIFESPLVAIATWKLTEELTRELESATVAALLVATSPAFIFYSGQVMTETPSLLLLTMALIVHLRGIKRERLWLLLCGAALLGAGVNVRETVAFYAPWLLIAPLVCAGKESPARKALWITLACAVFLVFAFGPFLWLFAADAGSFRASWYGWRESMRMESARHPLTIGSLLPFVIYFFLAAPVVFLYLPFALLKEWRERGLTCLLALACVGLWANLLLIFNYSTVINWRYFLTGLAGLTPLVADCCLRWQTRRRSGDVRRAFNSIMLALAFIAIVLGVSAQLLNRRNYTRRALTRDYRVQLALLPSDAVVMAGGQTVAVTYYRGIGAGDWDVIGTGGGWPGERLIPAIEKALRAGRRVFIDRDPRWWSACGWQEEETRTLPSLESHFRFRRISDTIFEIRPLSDESASDAPNLHSLLPENRPDDVRRCWRNIKG